ncbi:DUF6668 family protein [Actinoplanes sp. NPDC051494]|uniref:DUF6668 family protein n=1 Tax=Actinoplanes sp. NPDC051494 TaxID=3363907 RepID=UPI00379B3402
MSVDAQWGYADPAGAEDAGPAHPDRVGAGRLAPRGAAWVAAHGGSGATTLARVLGGADIGSRWPRTDRGEPARVLLVARTHAHGLEAASHTLNAMREGRHPAGMELVAVVLVADAPGSLPRPLVNRIRLLRSVAPVHRIPWIAQWRLGEQPARLPGQIERLGRQLQELGVAVPGHRSY